LGGDCQESEARFGQSFEEIHRWLDEFQGTPEYRMRHHEAGIREVKAVFGEVAAEATRQQIIADLKEERWNEADPFPHNEEDFVKIGFF
jgi:hypothetical protein